LRFDIVEKSLYVSGVPDGEYEDLIGSLLVSVEGVPLAELCQRQEQLQGTENEYRALQFLARESLWFRPYMEDLLPEWQHTQHVTVELERPGGEIQEISFDLPVNLTSLIKSPTQITLPSWGRAGFFMISSPPGIWSPAQGGESPICASIT
jgi:hypothetical protein